MSAFKVEYARLAERRDALREDYTVLKIRARDIGIIKRNSSRCFDL